MSATGGVLFCVIYAPHFLLNAITWLYFFGSFFSKHPWLLGCLCALKLKYTLFNNFIGFNATLCTLWICEIKERSPQEWSMLLLVDLTSGILNVFVGVFPQKSSSNTSSTEDLSGVTGCQSSLTCSAHGRLNYFLSVVVDHWQLKFLKTQLTLFTVPNTSDAHVTKPGGELRVQSVSSGHMRNCHLTESWSEALTCGLVTLLSCDVIWMLDCYQMLRMTYLRSLMTLCSSSRYYLLCR